MTPHQSIIATTELWPEFPGVTRAALRDALAEIATARQGLHGEWVASNRMTAAEQAREASLWAALQEDVARQLAGPQADGRHSPHTHGLTWAERRATLQREISYRQRLGPNYADKGRITPDQARHQLTCLLALLDIYEGGFDWQPANSIMPNWASIHPTPAERATREEWRTVRFALEGNTQQKEMIL